MRGHVGPDDLLDGVLGGAGQDDPERDTTHVVLGATGPESLLLELAAARNRGADGVGATFPAPGDPVGLRGPRDFAAAAIEAGEAALLLGAGTALVPRPVGRAVEWSSYSVDRRPPPDLGEADRALRTALLVTAQALADLDVARWRPEVADELHDLRAGVPLAAPSGTPPRCVELAGRALHLAAVVDLALEDDGGAVSASEAAARRSALAPLERAARHALTAACSPDGWPPPP
jgi:hypothetical protein